MNYILQNFTVKAGNHCFYSSIYNIFNYVGIPLEEYEIFFLCDGLAFNIELKQNSMFFDYILDAIKIDYSKQINILSKRINIQTTHFNDYENICKMLKKNRPVLAFLKAEALKYNIIENPRENLGAHGMVIYGFEYDAGLLHIADSYVLDGQNNVNTLLTQLHLEDIKQHIIGFCSFFTKECFFHKKNIYRSFCKSVENYFEDSWKNGEKAILYIIHHLDIINHDNNLVKANQNNYITLIFLMKAYYLNILNYIEAFISNIKPDLLEYLNAEINKIQVHLRVFFLRCLSSIEKTNVNEEHTINSGEKAIKIYSSLLNYLYDIVRHYC